MRLDLWQRLQINSKSLPPRRGKECSVTLRLIRVPFHRSTSTQIDSPREEVLVSRTASFGSNGSDNPFALLAGRERRVQINRYGTCRGSARQSATMAAGRHGTDSQFTR